MSRQVRTIATSSDNIGRPLAAAIAAEAPNQAPAPIAGPDVDVRLSLNRLLVEHVYLTGAAVEAAADGRVADAQARVAAASDGADEQVGDQVDNRHHRTQPPRSARNCSRSSSCSMRCWRSCIRA